MNCPTKDELNRIPAERRCSFSAHFTLALACVIACAMHPEASAQQIPCPVDEDVFLLDGMFNELNCEVTVDGRLLPSGNPAFTNRGATNAVLTNNGVMGISSGIWVNETGAPIENNSLWNVGVGGSAVVINGGAINNNVDGFVLDGRLTNTGAITNAGLWQESSGVVHTNSGDILNLSTSSMTLIRLQNEIEGMVNNTGILRIGSLGTANGGNLNAGEILNSGTFIYEQGPNVPLGSVLHNTATGTITNQTGGQATFAGGVENRGIMTNEVGNGVAFTVLGGGLLDNAGTFASNSLFVLSGPNATVNNTGVFNNNLFRLRITATQH